MGIKFMKKGVLAIIFSRFAKIKSYGVKLANYGK